MTAVLLLALILGQGLAAVAPPAAAVHEGEAHVATVRLDRRHVLEGTAINIRVANFEPNDAVRVRCECPPNVNDGPYFAPARPDLVFPRDFGEEAVRFSQPRWNATWQVELLRAGALPVPGANATFNSWITNVYRFPDREIEPGDRIDIQSSGYLVENLPVKIRLLKTNSSSETRRDVIWESEDVYPVNGTVSATFRFARSLAPLVRCPQDPLERCRNFFVRVDGGGKNPEEIRFYVRPARLLTHVLEQPTPDGTMPVEVNRTLKPHVLFQIHHRNGFEFVTPGIYDRGDGPKYRIERYPFGQPSEYVVVHNGTARWIDAVFAWYGEWKIPVDAPLRDSRGVPYRYRFVIPDQEDPYRNDVVRFQFNPIVVTRYTIPLLFERAPTAVERTEKAMWVMNLSYGDGTPFTALENRTQLRFCTFLRSEPRSVPCLNRPTFAATYFRGATWRVEHQWAIDDPRVDMAWLLHTQWLETNPVEDRWGNVVQSGMKMFDLVAAKPRIDLLTQVGNEARAGQVPLERGDLVRVRASIYYPDGTTPFNRTRNADGGHLPLYIVQRNPAGETVAIQRLNLTNPDNHATWVGSTTISRQAELSPTGTWHFQFDLRDKEVVPNANLTRFERVVVPASILVTTMREPPHAAQIGSAVDYRFRLAYRDGTQVTGDSLGVSIRSEVRPLRENLLAPPGAPGRIFLGPVVETLAPTWDRVRQDWVATWNVPRDIPLERYVIVPSGTDLSGNVVRSDVRSRPVQLWTETLERGVVQNPPARVPRGDRVVVTFDGREGDVGLNNTGKPVIEVQRFDHTGQQWITEYRDVRVPDEPGVEHVGIWQTALNTQAGTYRFRLLGKDPSFAYINATSRTFQLETVVVSRAALVEGEELAKGDVAKAAVAREDGDVLRDAYVVQDGKRGDIILTRRTLADRFEVEWQVPFKFPTGAFTIVIETLDRNQNLAYGEVGPFFVTGAAVRSEPVSAPTRLVPRGTEATWSFRAFYPSGDRLDGASGFPSVTVYNGTGPVASAKVEQRGPNYIATWEVPKSAGTADHWFEVAGRDAFGNEFIPIVSDRFRVEPGTYQRIINLLPPPTNPRDVVTGFRIFTDPDDRALEFVVVRLRADSATTARNNFQGQTVARGDVRLSSDGTLWVAEWRPLKDSPLGWYRFRIQGTDQYGNHVEQWSGAWQLTPSKIVVEFQVQPRELAPAEPATAEFRLRYPDQSELDDENARIVVQMMKDGVPVAPLPSWSFRPETRRWAVEWETPDFLEHGRYFFVVSGIDVLGNTVLSTASNTVPYSPTNVEKLLGIPGPGPLLLVLALLGAAMVLVRTPRRR